MLRPPSSGGPRRTSAAHILRGVTSTPKRKTLDADSLYEELSKTLNNDGKETELLTYTLETFKDNHLLIDALQEALLISIEERDEKTSLNIIKRIEAEHQRRHAGINEPPALRLTLKTDRYNNNALHMAMKHKMNRCLKKLLPLADERASNVNIDGENILQIGLISKNNDGVLLLKENHPDLFKKQETDILKEALSTIDREHHYPLSRQREEERYPLIALSRLENKFPDPDSSFNTELKEALDTNPEYASQLMKILIIPDISDQELTENTKRIKEAIESLNSDEHKFYDAISTEEALERSDEGEIDPITNEAIKTLTTQIGIRLIHTMKHTEDPEHSKLAFTLLKEFSSQTMTLAESAEERKDTLNTLTDIYDQATHPLRKKHICVAICHIIKSTPPEDFIPLLHNEDTQALIIDFMLNDALAPEIIRDNISYISTALKSSASLYATIQDTIVSDILRKTYEEDEKGNTLWYISDAYSIYRQCPTFFHDAFQTAITTDPKCTLELLDIMLYPQAPEKERASNFRKLTDIATKTSPKNDDIIQELLKESFRSNTPHNTNFLLEKLSLDEIIHHRNTLTTNIDIPPSHRRKYEERIDQFISDSLNKKTLDELITMPKTFEYDRIIQGKIREKVSNLRLDESLRQLSTLSEKDTLTKAEEKLVKHLQEHNGNLIHSLPLEDLFPIMHQLTLDLKISIDVRRKVEDIFFLLIKNQCQEKSTDDITSYINSLSDHGSTEDGIADRQIQDLKSILLSEKRTQKPSDLKRYEASRRLTVHPQQPTHPIFNILPKRGE